MLRHVDNKKIKGWGNIVEAWGFHYGGKQESKNKQMKRFMEKIAIPEKPIRKEGKSVYIEQDVLCSLQYAYIWGREDIAKYLGKSTVQLSRYIKHFRSLQNIVIIPYGKFIYVNRFDLDNWIELRKYSQLKKSDKWDIYMKEKMNALREQERRSENIYLGEYTSLCPICFRPLIDN